MTSVPPTAAPQPPVAGDTTRQALASLGGYVYQIYASCAAWLRLREGELLHLEVAEDYSTLLGRDLMAAQVKNHVAGSLTILSTDVLSTIDAFVDLVGRNPYYNVTVRLLTTSEIAPERAHDDRVGMRPALEAWRDAAENRLPGPELDELVRVLDSQNLKDKTLRFIRARTSQQLQAELFSRISWDTGHPDAETLRQQCMDMLVNVLQDERGLPPTAAARALPAVLLKLLETAFRPGPRLLRRGDLLSLLENQFYVSVPEETLIQLVAKATSAGPPASSGAALLRLQSLSAGFAGEVDIAGSNMAGEALRLSEGLFVPRDQGRRLLAYLRLPADRRDLPLSVVVGDAGHGKTSLLWWLYREMLDDQHWLPLFLPASSLAKPAAGTGLDADGLEQACELVRALGKTPLVLIDTVDLLLRDSEGAVAFTERLAALRAADAHVVLGTRPGELKRIDKGRFPYHLYALGTYSDPELLLALDSYAARYNYHQFESDLQGHFRRIKDAIASRHPLKDLCAIPLAMRLLFEIHAPHAIQPELNVFGLYCEYWRNRVQSDRRLSAHAFDTSAPGGHDCSAVATGIALQMLANGALELDLAHLRRLSASRDQPADQVSELLHRGILQQSAHGTVHFFHQSLFEHAAARGLVMLPGRSGLGLLSRRCRERPDDLFLKPILQHALLLAELDGGMLEEMRREFDALLASPDPADQGVAMHVHCHSHVHDKDRADKVRALVCGPEASEFSRVQFLRHAANMPRLRLGELAPLWHPMWTGAGMRVRKHMIRLLGSMASRDPQMVLAQVGVLGLHDCVFTENNGHDSVVNDYIELLGNLALSAPAVSAAACGFLGEALHASLASRTRFDCAAQVVSIIGRLDGSLVAGFLQGQLARHAEWDGVVSGAGIDEFARPYARLWARHWIAAGAALSQLMSWAPGDDGAALAIHLYAIDEFLLLQGAPGLAGSVAAVEAWVSAQAPARRILWARNLLGPLLGRARADAATQALAHQILASALDRGMDAWRKGKGRVELGIAVNMLDAAQFPAPEAAQLFAGLQADVTVAEWTGVPELTPFILPAMEGGLPSAQLAYDAVLAAPAAYGRAVSTLQSRMVAALRGGAVAQQIGSAMELAAHTGKAGWLKEILPRLVEAAAASAAFRTRMQQHVRDSLEGSSGKAAISVLQLLPDLVAAGVVDAPGVDDCFGWLDKLVEPSARLHLAGWMADTVCKTAGDAVRLLGWLDRHVLPSLQAGEVPPFAKDQYLRSCAALVRHGLLDPLAPAGACGGRRWADKLLGITLTNKARENHMSWYGWTISAVARKDPVAAAALFKELLGSAAARGLGKGSQRDLGRRLLSPLHVLIYAAGSDVREGLLEFAATANPRLARSIIQICLELNNPVLNARLDQLRTAPAFDADLSGLIARFRQYNPHLHAMSTWSELQAALSGLALPAATVPA